MAGTLRSLAAEHVLWCAVGLMHAGKRRQPLWHKDNRGHRRRESGNPPLPDSAGTGNRGPAGGTTGISWSQLVRVHWHGRFQVFNCRPDSAGGHPAPRRAWSPAPCGDREGAVRLGVEARKTYILCQGTPGGRVRVGDATLPATLPAGWQLGVAEMQPALPCRRQGLARRPVTGSTVAEAPQHSA